MLYKLIKRKCSLFQFKNKPFLNIRSSCYLKSFINCTFNVHTGRKFVKNDIRQLNKVFKEYKFFNFKIGQISYNRTLIERNRVKIPGAIILDLKKKRNVDIRLKKRKKTTFLLIK